MDGNIFLTAFAALFAIMNPFVALPMFLSLTEGEPVARQRREALRVAFYSAVLGTVILLHPMTFPMIAGRAGPTTWATTWARLPRSRSSS